MKNYPNMPANLRRLRTLPGHVAYVTGNRGPDQDAISVIGVDRLLLENEVSAVLVSLQPATSYGAYLRRGGTIDINTAGVGDDEAYRCTQETSYDNCPTGQNYKKAV
jgi:hypothetical protein